MASIFEQRSQELGMHQPRTQGSGSVFQRRAAETGQSEGNLKSAARTGLQVPAGIAQLATWPADIAELGRKGGIALIRKVMGDEVADQIEASGVLPKTQHEAEHLIEEKTGLPLEAHTPLQKGVRLGSMAASALPGTLAQRAAYGVGAPAVSQGLQYAGVPEPLAEAAGLMSIRPIVPGGGPTTPALPSIGKEHKPSGLTTRRYEKLTEPKAVSHGKKAQIEGKVEKEFRGIADKIISESPVSETYSQLKADTAFKENASQAFRDVEALSQQVPGTISTGQLKKNIVDKVLKKKGTGFTPSEYDTAHKKFIKQFIEKTPTQEISAKDLVTQFRKNNEALREAYEPGQSFAYNRAKREALQDYNKSIAETIQEQYPGTEFAELFKSSNEQWSKIMDAEAIDKFMDGLFNGKIRFEKGRQLFDKAGMTVPFKRALGPEGFKQFEQLNKDLLSTEAANRMLKVAAKQGFGDKLSTLAAYVMHPKIGYAKAGFDLAKGTYKKMVEFLLDKPQFTITWETGVKAFKKGDFKTATQAFQVLEAEQSKTAKEAAKASAKPKEPLTIEAKVEPIVPKEENPLLLEGPKDKAQAKEVAPEPQPVPESPKTKPIEAKESLQKYSPEEIAEMDYEYNPKLGRQELKPKTETESKAEPKAKEKPVISEKKKEAIKGSLQKFEISEKLREYGNRGEITVNNKNGKRVGGLEWSKTHEGYHVENVFSEQPGAALKGIVEFVNKFQDKTIWITPMTEKGSKAFELLLGHKIEPRIVKGETISQTLKRPRVDYKLTEADKTQILEMSHNIAKKTKLEALKEASTKEKRSDIKAKVDEKIEKMDRQDISKKGLKEQKAYLINELEEAIAKAPGDNFKPEKLQSETKEQFQNRLKKWQSTNEELLTFKVPGDGQFKIKNHKKALQAFHDSVEKRWPDKPLKITKHQLQQPIESKKGPSQKEYEKYIKKYGTMSKP